MVLKLHGHPLSTCYQRVMTVVKELGIDVEIIPVDLFGGEQKNPDFLKLQPFGVVPVLDDNSFLLYESRAITRYLVAVYGKDSKLVPKDIKENALFEQAASIEQSYFNGPAELFVYERIFAPKITGECNEAVAAEAQAKFEKNLEGYEVILSKHKYLAGDELTLADLSHLPYGTLAAIKIGPNNGFIDLSDPVRPNVARWWKDISSRPSWKAVHAETTPEDA